MNGKTATTKKVLPDLTKDPHTGKPARGRKATRAKAATNTSTSAKSTRDRLRDDMKIRVLRDNPHRENTKDRKNFEVVAKSKTWGEAKKAGINSGYIRHAEGLGAIAIDA